MKLFFLFLLLILCTTSNFTQAQHSLSGTIFNSSKKPIESAVVYLSNQEHHLKTVSNNRGFYSFNDLQNGVYHLMIETPFTYPVTEQFYIKDGGLQFDIQINEAISQTDLDSSLFSIVYSFKGGEEIEIPLATVSKTIHTTLKLPSDTVAVWIKNGMFLTMPFPNWPIKYDNERHFFYSEIHSKKNSTLNLTFDLESLPLYWEVNSHFLKSGNKENELINQTLIYMTELQSHSQKKFSFSHKPSLIYENMGTSLLDYFSILRNNIRMETNPIKKEIYQYGYLFFHVKMGNREFEDSLYTLVNPASPYLGLYHNNYIRFDDMWKGDLDKQISFTKKFIQLNPISDAKASLLTYTLRKLRNNNQYNSTDYLFFKNELLTNYSTIDYTKRYIEEEAAWIKLMKPE